MSQFNEGHRAGSCALPGWSKLAIGLITGLILTGCGGGGSGDKTSTPPPAPTPVVDPLALVSSTPANGATNVSPDVAPQLVFSAAVNNATANTTNVSLSHAGGMAVLGMASAGTQLTVTPSQRLLPLTDYTLNIGTGLTGMNGEKLASAQKLSFRTADREWTASQAIALEGSSPRIAVAADGSAIAVWIGRDGVTDSIYANRFVAGSGWGTAQRIETGSGDALRPNVAVDGKGNAIAVWAQSDGTVNSVYANRYVVGSGWGTAELIETGAGSADKAQLGAYTPPQLGFDGNGNAIVVWHQHDGTTTSIHANRYVAGSGWGTAEVIETSAELAERPSVGIDASGNAMAVWMQNDGTIYSVYANRYVAGNGWGSAQAVETATDTAYFPEIAVSTNGDAMAVWTQRQNTTFKVHARRYAPGSGWDATVQEIGTAAYGNQHQVAINASGQAFIIWTGHNGTGPAVYANRFTPASKWGSAQQIGYASDITIPQIVLDASGNALAAWIVADGTEDYVVSSRFTPDGGWTAAQLRSPSFISAYQLHLAIGASGDAFGIWPLWTMAIPNLHAARFE